MAPISGARRGRVYRRPRRWCREPAYNYEAFDFALEPGEFERWLQAGPGIGQEAPDFELLDLEGEALRLSAVRDRPVVLEFGSYTCPIFSDRVPARRAG